MSGRSELLLLDTNIVVHLIRDNEIGRRVDATFQVRHRPDRPLISIVTVGECLSLVRQFRWGSAKVEALEALLRELVIVPIDSRPVLERFGELHAWMKISRAADRTQRSLDCGDGWRSRRASDHDRRRLRSVAPGVHPENDRQLARFAGIVALAELGVAAPDELLRFQ